MRRIILLILVVLPICAALKPAGSIQRWEGLCGAELSSTSLSHPFMGLNKYMRGTGHSTTQLDALNMRKAIDMIHEKVLLSQIVGEYVRISPSGGDSYQCLCPFHNDKNNPSMGISDDKGLYNCFSCEAGGDAIKFVQEIEQSSFHEAVVKVIELSELNEDEKKSLEASGTDSRQFTKDEIEFYKQKDRIEQALRFANGFYASRLLSDPKAGPARMHLIERNISPQTVFKFKLGYAPGAGAERTLSANLTREGFTVAECEAAGLSMRGDKTRWKDAKTGTKRGPKAGGTAQKSSSNVYDRFRDRLMIPIFNPQGQVLGFGGRYLAPVKPVPLAPGKRPPPKYLNSPETALFKKSQVLFGMNVAKRAMAREGLAVVVEGYFDVIALHDIGIDYAVGAMGTALTVSQLEMAAKASKGKVVLLLDNDNAGQAATQRVIEQLLPTLDATMDSSVTLELKVAVLPRNADVKGETGYGEEGMEEDMEEDMEGGRSDVFKDAGDFCQKFGNDAQPALEACIKRAVGWKQWILDRMIATGGLDEAPVSFEEDEEDEEDEEGGRYTLATPAQTADTGATSGKKIDYILNPDALTQVARRIIAFLGTLPDSSDRTILSYYAAEKLSGGRDGMQLQLEEDFIRGSNEVAASKSPGGSGSGNTRTSGDNINPGSRVDRPPTGQRVSYSSELVSRPNRPSFSASEVSTAPVSPPTDSTHSNGDGVRARSEQREPASTVASGLFDDIKTPPTPTPSATSADQQSKGVREALSQSHKMGQLAQRLQQSQAPDSGQGLDTDTPTPAARGYSTSYSNSRYSESGINYLVEIGDDGEELVEINDKSMSSALEILASGGVTGSNKRHRRGISRAIKATLKPGQAEPSLWEAAPSLSSARQSSFDPVDPVTGSKLPPEVAPERALSESITRRAEGAERELLALYAFRPSLRTAVTEAVDRVAAQREIDTHASAPAGVAVDEGEAQPKGIRVPLSPWLNEAAEEVYSVLQIWHRSLASQAPEAVVEADMGALAPSSLMTSLSSSAVASHDSTVGYMPSHEAISLWEELQSLRDRIMSREQLTSEYAVMSAKQILSETHAKANQFQLLRRAAAINSLLGTDPSSTSSTDACTAATGSSNAADPSSMSDLTRQRARMVESFQRSMLSQEQGQRGEELLFIAKEKALTNEEVQALNDLAELPAEERDDLTDERGGREGDPDGGSDRRSDDGKEGSGPHPSSGKGANSDFDFDFDFGDIDERAVLAEGEMSPEEENYEKMEALRAIAGGKKKKEGEVLGVEFGLDESVLYEVPRERWRRSGYREKHPNEKSWRRTEDKKKRSCDDAEAIDNERYGGSGEGEISIEEYYEGEDFDLQGSHG